MDIPVRLTSGAPAAGLLLATILVDSLLPLYVAPVLIERNLLRRGGDYVRLVTSDSPPWIGAMGPETDPSTLHTSKM